MTTAILTYDDRPEGTANAAWVMHRDWVAPQAHESMGFADGWGSVTEQLAALAEAMAGAQRRARRNAALRSGGTSSLTVHATSRAHMRKSLIVRERAQVRTTFRLTRLTTRRSVT
ncbi:MAG: hypothetical protein ABI910_07380 [Gemmatimonadota bacterium]